MGVLTIKTQCNLSNAEKYFEEHLQLGDYYSQKNQVLGEWFGTGAERLGLTGVVKEADFLKLCRNERPDGDGTLTQRLKTTRWDEDRMAEVANRRVFYDFTFSPPKSVSVQAFVAKDGRIIEAHNRAIRIAAKELECLAGTQVHQGRKTSERLTGKVVCALFRHETSRALDPHLHTHCIMFNATYDAVENRWKALSNYEMLQARKYVENLYYHELARDLHRFGYEIENHSRGDFQVVGIPKELCARFSKRHNEIDERIEKLLREKPELAGGNLKELRAQIAQAERSRKISGIQLPELERLWASQVTPGERQSLSELLRQTKLETSVNRLPVAEAAILWAEDHLFDRHSVLREHELWSAALERQRGQSFNVDDLKMVSERRQYLRSEYAPGKITIRQILDREWEIICLAQDGKWKHPAFNQDHKASSGLMPDQKAAAEKILRSEDFVTLFCGGAGTGKSHTLREIGDGLTSGGHAIQVIAPQRQQALDLKSSFGETQTVSEFLTKRRMIPRSVVIVDEAGQIGGKQMHELLTFVHQHGGRVILSGDTRQHGAVEASDALRAIEKYSGLEPVRLTKIRRQNPKLGETKSERKRIKQYRAAVRKAQTGHYAESFDRLDQLGAIAECRTVDEQREQLMAGYVELAQRKSSVVVVSQTWVEIHEINERIRIGLRKASLIGKEDATVLAHERIDLTDAQKRDERFYPAKAVIIFNRDTGEFRKGDQGKLLKVTSTHLLVETESRAGKIAFKHLERLTVCRPVEMALTPGDRLQLKANAEASDGKPLVNGELVSVKSLASDGRIHLQDGRILPSNFRQFVRGYAVTSYGSQGKTVEHVLFSDSAVKAATNNQQWLVTISRGTRGIKIFTQDKERLQENVARLGNRELAIELVEPEVPKVRSLAPAVRDYIQRLFQSRRMETPKQTERNAAWKQNLHQTVRHQQSRGIRI
jgi:conjugative relaxase-like TrwC/TraI family protein